MAVNEMEIFNSLKDTLCVQEEVLKKLIWTLNKNYYGNLSQNILLLGPQGSGKTTLIKKTLEALDIPYGEVYGMYSDEVEVLPFIKGLIQIASKNSDNKLSGALLIHNMEDCFLNGGFNSLTSIINAGNFVYQDDQVFDISNITFIGEVNTNYLNDVFPKENDFDKDFDEGLFMSPILRIVKEITTEDNLVIKDEDGNLITSPYLQRYVVQKIKSAFLSSMCVKTFGRQIFMDDMTFNDTIKAVNSPISVLNEYRDDLDDEYIDSDDFVKKVASIVIESDTGLHSLADAIENVAVNDFNHKVKVFKQGSLLKPKGTLNEKR